jgi:hypothetical protein
LFCGIVLNQFVQGLSMLRKCVINVNQRRCPSTFLLLPKPFKDDTKGNKALFSKMKKIYDAVNAPRDTLISLLHDKYRVALVCEVCKLPPEDPSLWYKITNPKDIVGKILPLAKAGLAIVYAFNSVSAIARVFGLPTPVLQDQTFVDGQNLLNSIGASSLDDFPNLQKLAESSYSPPQQNTTPAELQSVSHLGYCMREFELFLNSVDPQKKWSNLSARVDDQGDLFYACPTCCLRS